MDKQRLLLVLIICVFLMTAALIFIPPASLSSASPTKAYRLLSTFINGDSSNNTSDSRHGAVLRPATRSYTPPGSASAQNVTVSGSGGAKPDTNTSVAKKQDSTQQQQQQEKEKQQQQQEREKQQQQEQEKQQQQQQQQEQEKRQQQQQQEKEKQQQQQQEQEKQQQQQAEAKPQAPAPEPTSRPLSCKGCFKSNFRNLTTIPEVCSPHPDPPEMLMMITTSLDGLQRRQAIRDTWVSATRGNTAHVRHVFLLGTASDGTVSDDIRKEAGRYGDMLVTDFVDVYGNLTYKTMAGLHYLVEHCGEAKFFLKTDQDMYVFVERLLSLAKDKAVTLATSLGGSCHQTGKPWRDPKTKYYASIRSYPQSTYPGFCSGTGYISSTAVARKILEVSPDIPFFHLEDVYLSLVLRHVGYRLTAYPGFAVGEAVCRSPRARSVYTIHEVGADKIRQMWDRKCGV